jgi:Flp pilus assembly protein TadD
MRCRIAVGVVSVALLTVGCASVQKTEGESSRRVRLAMADQLAQRGDWAGAFQIVDALTREDPTDATALLLRAKTLRKREMGAEAEADLRRVLQMAPQEPEAHAELGVLCENAARPQEALEQHKEAQRLSPGDPRYMNNLAFALLIRGRAKDAIPLLEEALRAVPSSPRLRNNMGFALASTGEFSRAAEQFRLGGTPPQAKNNLGFAYERDGNLAQAYQLYLEAARLDPADGRIRSNLEHVARETGREMPPELAQQATGAGQKGGG